MSRAAFLFLVVVGTLAGAAPVPKDKPGKTIKESQPPDLQAMLGESNWGHVEQRGRDVFLTGHVQWEATGRIRKDGSLLLAWTLISTGEVCPGVYQIDGKRLTGKWGYEGKVFIEPDGTLSGETRSDAIYKMNQ